MHTLNFIAYVKDKSCYTKCRLSYIHSIIKDRCVINESVQTVYIIGVTIKTFKGRNSLTTEVKMVITVNDLHFVTSYNISKFEIHWCDHSEAQYGNCHVLINQRPYYTHSDKQTWKSLTQNLTFILVYETTYNSAFKSNV